MSLVTFLCSALLQQFQRATEFELTNGAQDSFINFALGPSLTSIEIFHNFLLLKVVSCQGINRERGECKEIVNPQKQEIYFIIPQSIFRAQKRP